ncbi:MAG: NADH-quinone oxidoreductase subunit C, partial [Burkholderiaceae bacterium]|nr:NADH-quinone oxidoreductase subunit C [Burkholderiaceae bacterium]
GRLVSVWASERAGGFAVHAAYAIEQGLLWLELELGGQEPSYPDLSTFFPPAVRMQRAIRDLIGIDADIASDTRPWLDHGAWGATRWPLRRSTPRAAPFAAAHQCEPGGVDYPFVQIEGDGVHEIPVGPVHAGIIEPGHFRFSIVGEKVLRLEQRLGYAHKGIEKRFEQLAPAEGQRLAARTSGDSTVAFGWAYCMAFESCAGASVPPRAAALRALMLERERVANHLGDLGALGNDAALAFGFAQFSRLREDWLRASQQVFGHRLMMDLVVPGGLSRDVSREQLSVLRAQCDAIARQVGTLRAIYDEHAGLQDRFMTTGTVSGALAAKLGLTGLAARASGRGSDLRCDRRWWPYDALQAKAASDPRGDVAARVAVRFDEVFESLRLIRAIVDQMPESEVCSPLELPAGTLLGAGWVEGWRGEVLVTLELEPHEHGHRIARCHCHDPSWQNWPVLEHAVIGDIGPDFPLINKSFNLSYSGHDL